LNQSLLTLKLAPEMEKIRKKGSDLSKLIQTAAQEAQNRYHDALAHGVSAIALAFIVLAAAVVWGTNTPGLVAFSAMLDVTCFLVSIVAFWRAAHWNRIWMIRRAKSELVRQWCVLDNLLAPEAVDESTLETTYHDFSRRVDDKIGRESTSFLKTVGALLTFREMGHTQSGNDIMERVLEFWGERRNELATTLGGVSVSTAQYSVYFEKRPKTQAEWFPRARMRLAGQGHWRATTLLQLFLATLSLASMKAFVVLGASHEWSFLKPFLTFAIFLMIGVSAAISALYLNQNNRSLVHRYRSQERLIETWLSRHRPIMEKVASMHAAVVLAAAKDAEIEPKKIPGVTDSDVAESQERSKANAEHSVKLPAELWQATLVQMLDFEDLMIEELLDFISISEHDKLEISAA
jgi:hypothetical protein